MTDEYWRDKALCATIAPDIWFPEIGGSVQQQKAICAMCPVMAECLIAGWMEQDGIWGGTTPAERRAVRKNQRAAA